MGRWGWGGRRRGAPGRPSGAGRRVRGGRNQTVLKTAHTEWKPSAMTILEYYRAGGAPFELLQTTKAAKPRAPRAGDHDGRRAETDEAAEKRNRGCGVARGGVEGADGRGGAGAVVSLVRAGDTGRGWQHCSFVGAGMGGRSAP